MKNIIKNSQKRFGRIILVIINILLILAAVLSSLVYSDHRRTDQYNGICKRNAAGSEEH
jgi:hypothetical protein